MERTQEGMGRTRSQTRSALAAARFSREAGAATSRRTAKQEKQEEVVAESVSESESEYVESEDEEEEEAEEEGGDEADAVAEYERKRLVNIQRNLEFMQSMGVSTARMAARTAVNAAKKSTREHVHTTIAKRKKLLEEPPAPRRKSRRLEGKSAELLQIWQTDAKGEKIKPLPELPNALRGHFVATAVNTSEERGKKFLQDLVEEQEVEEREEDLKVDTTGATVVPYSLSERDIVKALPDRVYSMAFHPRADRVVVAAGDKLGNLALWSAPPSNASLSDDSQDPDVVVYRPHTYPITQLHYSPQDSTKLLSASFDGCVREFDLRGGAFTELLATSDSTGITSLALAGDENVGVYYASCDDGSICRLDRRESPTKPVTAYFNLHEKKINTVHCHPTRPFSIATASLDRTVCLWDARKLRKQGNTPLVTMPHYRSVNCAYFSPTGEHLVTVGQDNYVNIFSTLDDKHEDSYVVEPSIKIPHNNITGRWLTKLHASWDPKRPDQFVLGCMMQPRRIQIFRATRRNPLQELSSDLFNSVHSINVFHPHLDVIAGGNSSGRLCLWRASRSTRRRRKGVVIDLTE